jgi:hypothetical protein
VARLGHRPFAAIGKYFDDAAIGLEAQSQIGLSSHEPDDPCNRSMNY